MSQANSESLTAFSTFVLKTTSEMRTLGCYDRHIMKKLPALVNKGIVHPDGLTADLHQKSLTGVLGDQQATLGRKGKKGNWTCLDQRPGQRQNAHETEIMIIEMLRDWAQTLQPCPV